MPIGMTDKEREAVDLIIRYGSMKEACMRTGIPMNTLNQRMIRLRVKAEKYRLWIKEFERLKLQLPTKYVA